MVDQVNTQVAYTPPTADSEATKQSNTPSAQDTTEKEFSFFGEDGVTFWDMLDVINPLQHIPIVSTAYRAITGDELDPGARLAGGTLFGGPIGLAASAFNVILENNTGKDAGEHVLAMFEGEEVDVPAENQTMMAKNNEQPVNIAGFAPLPDFPNSESDAFAAGEASLRLAKLQEFMNDATATPVQQPNPQERGSGSAGVWAPPADQVVPFPNQQKQQTPASQNIPSAETTAPLTQTQAAPTAQAPVNTIIADSQQTGGFQAKQTHNEALDALRAFARDVNAQRQQDQAQKLQNPSQAQAQTQTQQTAPPAPRPANTAQLNQTQDNDWFTTMMSQNIKRYQSAQVGG
jgi:hypothetical protein